MKIVSDRYTKGPNFLIRRLATRAMRTVLLALSALEIAGPHTTEPAIRIQGRCAHTLEGVQGSAPFRKIGTARVRKKQRKERERERETERERERAVTHES